MNRACFPKEQTPEFTKKGEIHEPFVLALSLVWFAGATPDLKNFLRTPLRSVLLHDPLVCALLIFSVETSEPQTRCKGTANRGRVGFSGAANDSFGKGLCLGASPSGRLNWTPASHSEANSKQQTSDLTPDPCIWSTDLYLWLISSQKLERL